jgi:16S rRNA (uracil1498-N3)-methyltransferase
MNHGDRTLECTVSRARFYAPSIGDDARLVTLPADEAHHLRHVLRLGVGAAVTIFDGRGREWAGRVASVGGRGATVEVLGALVPAAEPSVRITLAVGITKGSQLDLIVRDATMLGVVEVQPMLTAHGRVPAGARSSRGMIERWRRIAQASAKQCGRAVVPVICPPASFDAVVAAGGSSARADLALIAVEPAAVVAPAPVVPGPGLARPRPASALVLVGPEGGWSADEIRRAVAAGARPVHLGPRTLRAETAPTVLLSALWTIWGW